MNIKIELPESLTVTSRDQSVAIDVSKLTPELVAKACLHGLTQKIADAAAGAKRLADDSDDMTAEEATVSLMQAVVESLEGGSWGRERGTGSGLSERDAVARIVVGGWFRDAYGKETDERQKYDASDAAGKYAIIDKIWADNAEVFGDAVDAEVQARKDAAKRKAAIKVAVSI